MKVAGVRAGTIKRLDVDHEDHKALVEFEITKGASAPAQGRHLRVAPAVADRRVLHRLQARHLVEKLPRARRSPSSRRRRRSRIDLVNNVLRKPYRERLGIILDELGAGVAGRAEDINDVVRRASPALRETDRVLAKLASQNQTLKQLVTDADTTLGDLADNKKDVGRWVVETKETAAASAERRDDIAAGLQRLPTFLRELRPTMAPLGDASEAQTPALQNLNASADQLATFLENLEAAVGVHPGQPALAGRGLAQGPPAVKAAQPVVAELDRRDQAAPELANNAAIVLEHLNDRKNAVEKDPRSPGGKGYTGFEAVLQWVFDQSQAINIYDKNGYMLKVNLFHSKCSDYQNPESLKEEMAKDPSFYKDCAAILGPTSRASPRRPDRDRPPVRLRRSRASSTSPSASRRPTPSSAEQRARPVKDRVDGPQEEARQGRAAQARDRAPAQGDREGQRTSRSCASASRTSSASSCPTRRSCPPPPTTRRRPDPDVPGPAAPVPQAPSLPTRAPPASSSTTCSRHEEDRSRHRVQPRPRRRRDDPRRDRRGVPVLQRQPGPAVRADDARSRCACPTAPTSCPATRSARAAAASA